jgi:YfiH family protein
MSVHPDWIVPEWPAPSRVRAFITTRAGGVSTGAYASLNLGASVDDDPDAVAENRRRVRAALPADPIWLKQVHGTDVIDADAHPRLPHADASIASMPGTVCAIQAADCVPVLFTDLSGSVVAAAHAGWRGLAGGVLGNTVAAMQARGTRAEDILAYIGPGIGAYAFEVGQDVYDAFTARDPGASTAFVAQPAGKWLANLHALVQRALRGSGVTRIYGEPLCTVSDPARFFSHRRDRITGRLAALIWRVS